MTLKSTNPLEQQEAEKGEENEYKTVREKRSPNMLRPSRHA